MDVGQTKDLKCRETQIDQRPNLPHVTAVEIFSQAAMDQIFERNLSGCGPLVIQSCLSSFTWFVAQIQIILPTSTMGCLDIPQYVQSSVKSDRSCKGCMVLYGDNVDSPGHGTVPSLPSLPPRIQMSNICSKYSKLSCQGGNRQ